MRPDEATAAATDNEANECKLSASTYAIDVATGATSLFFIEHDRGKAYHACVSRPAQVY